MAKIFHLIPRSDWEKTPKDRPYSPYTLENDGFIHCCKADQILLVANMFFKNIAQVTLLRINESELGNLVKIEAPLEKPNSKMKFPHVYGPITLESIEAEFNLKKDAKNGFILPLDLLK